MFQVNATLAILLSFFISFVDELGEMDQLTNKKMFLISAGLLALYLIYKESRNNNDDNETTGQIGNIKLSTKMNNVVGASKK